MYGCALSCHCIVYFAEDHWECWTPNPLSAGRVAVFEQCVLSLVCFHAGGAADGEFIGSPMQLTCQAFYPPENLHTSTFQTVPGTENRKMQIAGLSRDSKVANSAPIHDAPNLIDIPCRKMIATPLSRVAPLQSIVVKFMLDRCQCDFRECIHAICYG